ncbi:MAG: DUF4180 domain-containing protein [Bacteroidetes bacterium]|nr:DUF4180 domain-containing protein [Bacteroidota bacterium]
MDVGTIEHNGGRAAQVIADGVALHGVPDALDLLARCWELDAAALILRVEHCTPDFFRLRTGIAGDVLQKFSTYGLRLAIVGDPPAQPGRSLADLIRESNAGRQVHFAPTLEEALDRLFGDRA